MSFKDKAKIFGYENYGYIVQSFRIPVKKDWQDRRVEDAFHAANAVRRRNNIPLKNYRLYTKKGVAELV